MKSMSNNRGNVGGGESGYTLVEVALSMGFIAFIITILAATTVNIVRTYTKGMWLSQINSAGQAIIEDMDGTLKYSAPATVKSDDGRICVDKLAYVWNSENNSRTNKIKNSSVVFSLIKVEGDNAKSICQNTNDVDPSGNKITTLLGRGAKIRYMSARQDNNLLSISMVVSTSNGQQPYYTWNKRDGTLGYSDKYRASLDNPSDNSDPHWQCGDSVDGKFVPGRNQYCAFAEYNFTVYQRGGTAS